MNNSSLRIFLQLILITSFIVVSFTLDDVFADEKKITSKSIAYENTSIIEFTNNGLEEIETIRIWIQDSSFVSFKPQNGWVSPIASIATITFTTLEPLKINEIVKFGIITEKHISKIQWEALNKEGNLIENGITSSQNISSFLNIQEQKLNEELAEIFSNSTFRVIPKDLHPGSTIRVTGDNFVPNSNLTLFQSGLSPRSFLTDENGHFMLTMKISENQKTDQINFALRDKQENEKIISLYVTEIRQEISTTIDFTVSEIQNKFYRSESVKFSGTTNPDSIVLITIKNSQDNLFSTEIKNADSKGDWSALIYVSPTTPLGTYTAEITDGKNTIIKSWDVVFSKKLHILPTKLTFKSNELITFNGTATPDERISIKLVNPQGNEVLSKNFVVNPSGFFEIEYPTLSSSSKGTYVLYAFQKYETQIIFVGLDVFPKKILSTQLNSVNYRNNDIAIIGITGEDSQDITLLILDDNDHEKFNDKIELGPDGKRTYHLNLSTFPTGVYTVLVSMASFQASDVFTVDLQSSHAPITFDMIKNTYIQGESIFVSGKSQPDTRVNLFLIDPNGIIINEQETFVDETGSLFATTFLIPYNESFGKWIIRAESGLNFVTFEFQVISLGTGGLSVSVTDIISSDIGTFVTIEGFVTEEQIVSITIDDPNGNTIFQTNIETTETGEFDLLWNAPPEAISGTYSVIVTDSFEKTTSSTFDL